MEQRAHGALRWVVLAVVVALALPAVGFGAFRWRLDDEEAAARRIAAARVAAAERIVVPRVVVQGTPRDVDGTTELLAALTDATAARSGPPGPRLDTALDALEHAATATHLSVRVDEAARGEAAEDAVFELAERARARGGAVCVHDALDDIRVASDLSLLGIVESGAIARPAIALLECASDAPSDVLSRAADALRALGLAPMPSDAAHERVAGEQCLDRVHTLDQLDRRPFAPFRTQRHRYDVAREARVRCAEGVPPAASVELRDADAAVQEAVLTPRAAALVLRTVLGGAPPPGDSLWATPAGGRIVVTHDADGGVDAVAELPVSSRPARFHFTYRALPR